MPARSRRRTAWSASPAAAPAKRSRSSSKTTAPASGPTPWRRYSSVSTPTGRSRVSARIPGSASPSPSRSSKPMAGGSPRATAPRRRMQTGEVAVLGACFTVHLRVIVTDCAAVSATTPPSPMPPPSTPAAVLVGARAVLIRGPAGAGKSRLALELIQAAAAGPAGLRRLIADDRVHVAAAHGRLIARAPANLAGLLEIRGIGIRRLPYEPMAVVRPRGRPRDGDGAHAGGGCHGGRDRGRAVAASCGRTGRGCLFACARRPHITQVSPGSVIGRQFFGRALASSCAAAGRQPHDAARRNHVSVCPNQRPPPRARRRGAMLRRHKPEKPLALGLGMVMIEALSCGAPACARRVIP